MANHDLEKLATKLRVHTRWSEALARDVVDAWRASGLSGIAAARLLNVDPQRLYWWRDRLGVSWTPTDVHVATTPSVHFARVVVCDQPTPVRIVVELGNSIRVQVNDVDPTTAAWVALLASSVSEVRA